MPVEQYEAGARRESARDARIRGVWNGEIARFKGLLRIELKALQAAIRQHPDLAQRLDLIASIDGIGLRTALAILARMPEIGRITREQAAALAGLAPYDDDRTPTTSRTAAADARNAFFSSAVSFSLTISSMPPAPSFTGTPM